MIYNHIMVNMICSLPYIVYFDLYQIIYRYYNAMDGISYLIFFGKRTIDSIPSLVIKLGWNPSIGEPMIFSQRVIEPFR